MINYRVGTGKRGSYNILIHKHLARTGSLRGYRLNAFAENSLQQPLYDWPNGGRTEDGVSTDGGCTVRRLSADGAATEDVHHQELQEFKTIRILEGRKGKSSGRVVGRESEPPPTPDEIDLSFDAAAGLDLDQPSSSSVHSECSPALTIPDEGLAHFSVPPASDCPDSEELSRRLFVFLKSPKKYAQSLSAWSHRFATLLKEYSFEDVAGTMEFGFAVDDFWPEKLFTAAGKDHCVYYIDKFPTILAKFRGRTQSANNAAQLKTQLKENTTNGKQAHQGKGSNARTSGNHEAVAETIEWLRQQQSAGE